MKFTLHIWRQENARAKGHFETYEIDNISADCSFLEMLDQLNEKLINDHIAHHVHAKDRYVAGLADVEGITVHVAPEDYMAPNYWLNTITIDPSINVKGQEMAYKKVISGAVGGAAGVIHAVDCPTTDCQPNDNVEALRMGLDALNIESRPLWKPMHKQPVYKNAPAYINGVSEDLFKVGMCLPSGPYVTEEDVRFIVEAIKELIGN